MDVQTEAITNEKLGTTHDQKYLTLGEIKIPFRDHVIDIMAPIKELNVEQQRKIAIHGGVMMPDGLSEDQIYRRALHVVQKSFLEATLTQGVSLETAVSDRDTVPHLNELQYINIKNRLENHMARVNQYAKENEALENKAEAAAAKPPKAPKPPKEPKEPKEPKAPKAAKPESTTAVARFTSSMTYVVNPEADIAKHQPWLDENIFRKQVFEVVVENPGLTAEQIMPLFVTKAGAGLRAADGGKNQTKYRLNKELVPAGLVLAVETTAPAEPAQTEAKQ